MRKLALHPNISFVRTSRGYRTPPMKGGRANGWFLNSVGCFRTTLAPEELLRVAKELEQLADRRRAVFWGDRTLDLDLLMYGNIILQNEDLQLPHPSLLKRPFVTTPLLEIHPDVQDPRTGRCVKQTAQSCGPRAVPVAALAGPPKVP